MKKYLYYLLLILLPISVMGYDDGHRHGVGSGLSSSPVYPPSECPDSIPGCLVAHNSTLFVDSGITANPIKVKSSLPMKIDTIREITISPWWIHDCYIIKDISIDTTYILTPEQVEKALAENLPCGSIPVNIGILHSSKTGSRMLYHIELYDDKGKIIASGLTDRQARWTAYIDCNCGSKK